MRAVSLTILGLLGLLLLAAGPASAAPPALSLSLQPAQVDIDTFFDGASLRVEGLAPAGSQVAVILFSAPSDMDFRIKSRLWGFLWMNREEVAFHGAPSVYLYQGSGGSPDDFKLGLDHLQAMVRIKDGHSDPAELFKELVRIKQSEGLYNLSPQGVSLGSEQNGLQPFSCAFELPARLPQGTYQVQAFARDSQGQITSGPTQPVKAQEVGFPALLSSLAYNYGLLYGILAALLALVGGLVTSIMFKGGGGAH
jgi:hypothetical protein